MRVRGSVFRVSPKYQVKLEGAALAGFRTIFIGGVRDPIFIAGIDTNLARVQGRLKGMYPEMKSGAASLTFHVVWHQRRHGRVGADQERGCRTK